MPLDLADSELATAAQACRAMAYQEGERARRMEDPNMRAPMENTAKRYAVLAEKLDYSADDLISISPELPNLSALLVELSQPTYGINAVGKVVIDKKPAGTKSPNLADAVMICYQPGRRWMETWLKL